MIKIAYEEDRDKRECVLRLNGHAGQADVGQDIVCASATILAYTMAQIIKDMELHEQLAKPPTVELERGDATIRCQAKDDKSYEKMLHSFYVVNVGYAVLAHNYPQFVEAEKP